MKVNMIHIADLKPYANNPRKNDGAVDAVANSIKQFGFKVPVIIDKNNEIVAGHTRVKAAQKLGLSEIPCIIADDLTDEQIKAFRLADNKTHELAEWDFDLLNVELDGIFDIDMADFEFEDFKLEDDYDTDFTLPSNDREPFVSLTFTLADEQAELIKYAMSAVKNDITETFGNENSNGNALYEVVRQWGEQKKSN